MVTLFNENEIMRGGEAQIIKAGGCSETGFFFFFFFG
jgi:hypothetical protein